MRYFEFDEKSFVNFLCEAINHYEETAPSVSQYLNTILTRHNETSLAFLVYEVDKLQFLYQSNSWLKPYSAKSFIKTFREMAKHQFLILAKTYEDDLDDPDDDDGLDPDKVNQDIEIEVAKSASAGANNS